MKSELEQYLAEAQAIVDRVELEHRGLTHDERRRAEKALERIGELRDNEALRKAVEDMNGSLNRASPPQSHAVRRHSTSA